MTNATYGKLITRPIKNTYIIEDNMDFDKEDYKILKRMAKEAGAVVACRENSFGTYNGITIAYKKATTGKDCRMVHVAVSYCAPEDRFKKKVGKYMALYRLFGDNPEVVKLPLADYVDIVGTEEASEFLLDMFSV